jgi:hypothetical protein
VDVRHGNFTSRELATAAFSAATDSVIGNFDAALSRFEADMRADKAVTAATIRLSVWTQSVTTTSMPSANVFTMLPRAAEAYRPQITLAVQSTFKWLLRGLA